MTWLRRGILAFQLVPAAALLVHAGLQFSLLRAARSGRSAAPPVGGDAPSVTVQLPVYNEKYVVARLLEAVSRLQYPAGRLQIQVLDDSIDETSRIIERQVRHLRASGLDVAHIHRADRDGYKAGALAAGMASASGELVAIFDADALPPPEFLLTAVPHFADPAVGLVQARWRHDDRDRSWLGRVQALMLDAHFHVEQAGRSALGCFINFNGTAGVWRAEAIRDAGGWSAATLTEDLDLSYRAQLRGWRFVYRHDLTVPVELPIDVRAFRRQQYRWMKGVAKNARRLQPSVVRAPLRPLHRLHACAQLLETTLYPVIVLQAALSIPVAVLAARGGVPAWLAANPLALVSFLLLWPVYREGSRASSLRFLIDYVSFLGLTTGLSLHNSIAVLSGLAGRGGTFERTPKRGAADRAEDYRLPYFDPRVPFEAAAWAGLAAGLFWAAREGALLIAWLPVLWFVTLTAGLAALVFGRRAGDRWPVAAGRPA